MADKLDKTPSASEQIMYPEDYDFEPTDFAAPAPDPDSYVTVLHGYGRRRPNERHFLDQYEGRGGVIKNVPRSVAEKWAKLPTFRIHVLDNEATEVDYAKAAGIRPMNPKKLAAVLGASDMDELVAVLGEEKTQRIVEALQRRLAAAQSRATQSRRARQAAADSLS